MPAIVTSNFRLSNAKQFINSFQPSTWGGFDNDYDQSIVYLFIGKSTSWDTSHAGFSDTVIPSPDGDVQGNSYAPWRDMLALDRVANTEIVLGAKRYDWVTGQYWARYDDQDKGIAQGTKKFFVRNSLGQVLKCLDNNNDGVSTVEPIMPSGELSRPHSYLTSDGYRWKYMLTIPDTVSKTFLSTNYMPIHTLNAFFEVAEGSTPTIYSDQGIVQRNANAGVIDAFVVVDGGSGYTAHSGDVDATNRTLKSNVSGVIAPTTDFELTADDAYADLALDHFNGAYFVSYSVATGTVQHSSIITDQTSEGASTTGAGVKLTLADAPDGLTVDLTGSPYHIGPRIEITGDGQGANVYAIMTGSGASQGIGKLTVLPNKFGQLGNNYTTANVFVIKPVTTPGSEVNLRAIIPPPGGHGSDPAAELNAWNVIVSKKLSGNLAQNPATELKNLWPTQNQWRTLGLVRNPILSNGYSQATIAQPGTVGKNWFANSTPLHQSTWIYANTASDLTGFNGGDWEPGTTEDEIVVGLSSGASARLVEYTNAGDNNGKMVLTNVTANSTGGKFHYKEKIHLKGAVGNYKTVNGVFVTAAYGSSDATPATGQIHPIKEGELVVGSGDILYVEHRTPITRTSDQAEEIKIIIEF